MGDKYGRAGSTYDNRKGYAPSDYIPSSRQQGGPQSDYYDNRERPYDTLYKRSYDDRADRSGDNTRSSSRRRSVARYDERKADYESDRYNDRDNDRRGGGRSGVSRRDRDYDSPDGRSESDYEQKGRDAKQEGRRRLKEKEEKLEGVVGKEQKDIAATVIGALAGGFLGYEAGRGRPAGALGGALLGGFAGNAIEHRHIKRQTDREKRESRYDSD